MFGGLRVQCGDTIQVGKDIITSNNIDTIYCCIVNGITVYSRRPITEKYNYLENKKGKQ
jgi:hypothetical protein